MIRRSGHRMSVFGENVRVIGRVVVEWYDFGVWMVRKWCSVDGDWMKMGVKSGILGIWGVGLRSDLRSGLRSGAG